MRNPPGLVAGDAKQIVWVAYRAVAGLGRFTLRLLRALGSLRRPLKRQLSWLVFSQPRTRGKPRGYWAYSLRDHTWRFYAQEA